MAQGSIAPSRCSVRGFIDPPIFSSAMNIAMFSSMKSNTALVGQVVSDPNAVVGWRSLCSMR